jgi:fumarate reductase subunit D
MSYYGSWPNYKTSKLRGPNELLWKSARASWEVDRILLPVVLLLAVLAWYMGILDEKDRGPTKQ